MRASQFDPNCHHLIIETGRTAFLSLGTNIGRHHECFDQQWLIVFERWKFSCHCSSREQACNLVNDLHSCELIGDWK